jgi:hypothetical protein
MLKCGTLPDLPAVTSGFSMGKKSIIRAPERKKGKIFYREGAMSAKKTK